MDEITHGSVSNADAEFAYAYTPNSHLIQTITTNQSGITGSVKAVTNDYEAHRDLLEKKTVAQSGGTPFTQVDYSYNEIGQRTAFSFDGSVFAGKDGGFTFDYNSKGEVVAAKSFDSPGLPVSGTEQDSWSYGYDEIGNRLTSSGPNAAATATVASTYIPNVLNQYSGITTDSNLVFKGHDDDGNLTDDGSKTYVWDAENRLVEVRDVSDNSLIAEYRYDYRSRQVWKKVHIGTPEELVFVYDGWNLLAEYEVSSSTNRAISSSDSPIRKYTWGTDLSGTKVQEEWAVFLL